MTIQQGVAALTAAALAVVSPAPTGGEIVFDIRKDSIQQTEQGFWIVEAAASRTGVQTYIDITAPGGCRREYRSPEEVTSPESLATYSLAPVTMDHPPERVTAENSERYQKGLSIGEAKVEGDLVLIQLLITSATLIGAIQRGELTQVSCGYACKVIECPGVSPDGEAYTHLQIEIRINHIAVVKYGRGGPRVRLRLDSEDGQTHFYYAGVADMPQHLDAKPLTPGKSYAVLEVEDPDQEMEMDGASLYQANDAGLLEFKKKMKTKGAKSMAKLSLDGAEYDNFPSELVPVVQGVVLKRDSAEATVATLTTEKTAIQGRLDAAEEQITSLKADLEAAKAANGNAQTKEVMDAIDQASDFLPQGFKWDGQSAVEIKKLALLTHNPKATLQDDPVYISARFDSLVEFTAAAPATGPSAGFQQVIAAATQSGENGQRHDGAPKKNLFDEMCEDLTKQGAAK